jgi:hypothetical protein
LALQGAPYIYDISRLRVNLETTILTDRPRNRWQDEVREDGRIVGGEEWQEEVYKKKKRNGKSS